MLNHIWLSASFKVYVDRVGQDQSVKSMLCDHRIDNKHLDNLDYWIIWIVYHFTTQFCGNQHFLFFPKNVTTKEINLSETNSTIQAIFGSAKRFQFSPI